MCIRDRCVCVCCVQVLWQGSDMKLILSHLVVGMQKHTSPSLEKFTLSQGFNLFHVRTCSGVEVLVPYYVVQYY